MQLFAAHLTMLALAAHAAVGCAWHHRHAAVGADGAISAADFGHRPAANEGHRHAAPSDPSGDQHQPEDGETGCNLVVGSPRSQAGAPPPALALTAPTPPTDCRQIRLAESHRRVERNRDSAVPLHLLFGVLVI